MNSLSRRKFLRTLLSFLMVAVALTLTACSAKSKKEESNTKPNIIFIMADDLGYADLGSFGSKKISTPNVDQLIVETLMVALFVVVAAYSLRVRRSDRSPSRISLLRHSSLMDRTKRSA